MPVTLIGSKWSSGSLIFFTKSTGAAVITIAPALVTITPATTITGILTSNGGITFGDAKNIITNATTGTKIGTATSQKIGFWNATPIIQPIAVADVGDGLLATTITQLNALLARVRSTGLIAT